MKFFLTLKHWHIFLLTFGLAFLFQFVLMGSIVFSHSPMVIFRIFPVMMVLLMLGLFGWFYALGTNLHTLLPEGVVMSLGRFRIFMLIPFCYLIAISIAISSAPFLMIRPPVPSVGFIFAIFAVIFPLHIFSLFCIFHTIWFIAKELKSIELQKPVTFSDFAGEFFFLWFFPFGVWFIQPRINKLFSKEQ